MNSYGWTTYIFVLVNIEIMSSILDLDSCAYANGMLFELFTLNVGIAMEVGESQPKFMTTHTNVCEI